MPTILIVDDDSAMREALDEAARDLGFDTRVAPSGASALAVLDEGPVDAVLLDLRMPGMDGLETLRRMRARRPPPPVTVLTAYATAQNTIEAMRLGAFDHLVKPIARSRLELALRAMVEAKSTSPAVPPVEAEPNGLVGSSEAMRAVEKAIGMLADSEATTLITGDTGTGKELVARAIHAHGVRRAKPFVAVNCAAIPAELLESELFGVKRGAFTGAISDRTGAFRDAAQGTLFLDEIGDMDATMQGKILRALQEREVTPVGGKPTQVDVRVIAATHRDLRALVREGRFREDLFYRLHVVPIELPPLRERLADIVPLAELFLTRAGKRLGADAAARLLTHSWPGNVRELKNAMERAAVLVRGDVVRADDLSFIAARSPDSVAIDWPDEDIPSAIARLEAMLIRRALMRSEGNRAEATRALGIHRQLLYAKMKRYGLDASAERTADVGAADGRPPPERK
jgi:two-component system NtrC family response regulator